MKAEMTGRERWKAVLNREAVDRVPCDFWGTPEVVKKLASHFGVANEWWAVVDRMQIDAPYSVEPDYIGPPLAKNEDFWGIRRKQVSYQTGSYDEATDFALGDAKGIEDIDRHRWPKADWFDYSQLGAKAEANAHRPLRAGYIEPFLVYSWLRGIENAMMDMAVAPEMVECAFDHIIEFGRERLERVLEATKGNVDYLWAAEDLGSQTGPLFSVDCFRRFHKERFRKYISIGKQAGMKIFWHSDGACRDFIPELIEIGVDMLNPIQHVCPGMERTSLKKDFGDKLIFHGGVENQQILPFGTPDEVRKEVIDCFEMLGTGGGYICGPCHNIQPVTPVENIIAMYETIREISGEGKYTRPA